MERAWTACSHTGVVGATGWSHVDQTFFEGSNHGPQFHAGSGELLFCGRQLPLQVQLDVRRAAAKIREEKMKVEEERGARSEEEE